MIHLPTYRHKQLTYTKTVRQFPGNWGAYNSAYRSLIGEGTGAIGTEIFVLVNGNNYIPIDIMFDDIDVRYPISAWVEWTASATGGYMQFALQEVEKAPNSTLASGTTTTHTAQIITPTTAATNWERTQLSTTITMTDPANRLLCNLYRYGVADTSTADMWVKFVEFQYTAFITGKERNPWHESG